MINLRSSISKLLKDELQINESITFELFDRGLLNIQACRNALIKEEYNKKIQPKEKQRVKGNIAERYCISINLVEKIVSQN